MAPLYTVGEWIAKVGQEEEFVEAWREFADWTVANVSGSTWAKLVQDSDAPQRFVSFGPWADEQAVEAWRQHPRFQEHVSRIRGLVDSFTPGTMTVATQVGPATPDP